MTLSKKLKIGIIPLCFILLSGSMGSCDNKPNRQIENKPKKNLTAAENADLERASFDKLPDHNDSITGCWLIDPNKSFDLKLKEGVDIDAFFFLEEHKRLVVFDSSQYNEFQSQIGFFRFYNNELTFEITSEGEPFQDFWKVKLNGNKMIVENRENPKMILYMTKIDKKKLLR